MYPIPDGSRLAAASAEGHPRPTPVNGLGSLWEGRIEIKQSMGYHGLSIPCGLTGNSEPDRCGDFRYRGDLKTRKNPRRHHGIVSSLRIVFDLQQSCYRNTLARLVWGRVFFHWLNGPWLDTAGKLGRETTYTCRLHEAPARGKALIRPANSPRLSKVVRQPASSRARSYRQFTEPGASLRPRPATGIDPDRYPTGHRRTYRTEEDRSPPVSRSPAASAWSNGR